ncbi:MAG: GNAT family N-acetyltransferase [Ruminococcaceae bacterium]|nr:GNAT family N-acetyltransferase [Oscillospiraceae bacterium]
MPLEIVQGQPGDANALEALYNAVHDHLARGVNWPGWEKGIYPTRRDAERGLEEDSLFVAKDGADIAGSIILSHRPEPAFMPVKWLADCDYSEVFVIRTFVVHPHYLRHGVGRALLAFAQRQAQATGMRSLRLDVFRKNTPAIRLYEQCGYTYIDTVDLGLAVYGLDRFHLYERLV